MTTAPDSQAKCYYIDRTTTPPTLKTDGVTMSADKLSCETTHLTDFVVSSDCAVISCKTCSAVVTECSVCNDGCSKSTDNKSCSCT